MQFIHEIMPDAVNGDREMVSCNGLERTIVEFQKLEPDYPSLPDNIMGFVYQPGATHYYYDKAMSVTNIAADVEPIVAINILDGFLSKTDQYIQAINAEAIDDALQVWDTGTAEGNREKRILELKEEMKRKMAITDWFIIRHQETGKVVPLNIKQDRNLMRENMENAKTSINSLTGTAEIKNFNPDW